jgi:hypothetical protein
MENMLQYSHYHRHVALRTSEPLWSTLPPSSLALPPSLPRLHQQPEPEPEAYSPYSLAENPLYNRGTAPQEVPARTGQVSSKSHSIALPALASRLEGRGNVQPT